MSLPTHITVGSDCQTATGRVLAGISTPFNTLLNRSIPDLVARFRAGTLARDEWTHEAHLAVVLVACREEPSEDAVLKRMRADIKRYNDRNGIENGSRSGYHETLTCFWVRAVASFAQQHSGPLAEVFPLLLEVGGNARTPLRFGRRARSWIKQREASGSSRT